MPSETRMGEQTVLEEQSWPRHHGKVVPVVEKVGVCGVAGAGGSEAPVTC